MDGGPMRGGEARAALARERREAELAARRQPAPDPLPGELAAALADALEALAVARLALLHICRRPSPLDAERALLRLAVRSGHTGPLPLTGARLMLWRAWDGLAGEGTPRARWRAVRASLAELVGEGAAGAAGALAEADRIDPRAPSEDAARAGAETP